MASVLDRVKKLKNRRQSGGDGGRMQGIFHRWNDGDNIIRLVGDFLEVRTHFISPAPKRNEKGLCRADAFQGDGKLPVVINCLDWDIDKEEAKSVKTCPICKLNAIAHAILKEKPDDKEEKEMFEKLRSAARAGTFLKWNILDREDPYVVLVEDGGEKKVLGLKIATVGMEAWGDVEGIFDQMGFDITDSVDGIDIKVTKGHNGTRVSYSAQAVIDSTKKPPVAKVTPLTDEEKSLKVHELKAICGKQVDSQKVIDSLHEELRELLDIDVNEDEGGNVSETAPVSSGESREKQSANDEESDAIKEALSDDDGDGDGLLDGTSEKKD